MCMDLTQPLSIDDANRYVLETREYSFACVRSFLDSLLSEGYSLVLSS